MRVRLIKALVDNPIFGFQTNFFINLCEEPCNTCDSIRREYIYEEIIDILDTVYLNKLANLDADSHQEEL